MRKLFVSAYWALAACSTDTSVPVDFAEHESCLAVVSHYRLLTVTIGTGILVSLRMANEVGQLAFKGTDESLLEQLDGHTTCALARAGLEV